MTLMLDFSSHVGFPRNHKPNSFTKYLHCNTNIDGIFFHIYLVHHTTLKSAVSAEVNRDLPRLPGDHPSARNETGPWTNTRTHFPLSAGFLEQWKTKVRVILPLNSLLLCLLHPKLVTLPQRCYLVVTQQKVPS